MKTEKPALQVLQEARLLILDPSKWGQGYFKNRHGQFCATGALREVQNGSHFQTPAYAALAQAMRESCGWSIAVCEFNDRHTHAEVIDAFDRAIAAEDTRG